MNSSRVSQDFADSVAMLHQFGEQYHLAEGLVLHTTFRTHFQLTVSLCYNLLQWLKIENNVRLLPKNISALANGNHEKQFLTANLSLLKQLPSRLLGR